MSFAVDPSGSGAEFSVPADQLNRVVALLENFSSPDNALRKQAEDELTTFWMQQYPVQLVISLCQLCGPQSDSTLASMSCVLLRRLCFHPFVVPSIPKNKGTLWKTFDAKTREFIKTTLLSVFLSKSLPFLVRHKLADVVAEIARASSGNWPALIDAILGGTSGVGAQTLGHAIPCFRVIYSYPSLIKSLSASVLNGYFSVMLHENHPESFLNEAIKAYVAVMICVSQDASLRNSLASLMNQVLTVVAKMAHSGSEDLLLESLTSLTDLAEDCAKAFKDCVGPLTLFLVEIVANTKDVFEDHVRQVAVELFVMLCEKLTTIMKRQTMADKHQMLKVIFERLLPDVQEDEAEWFECENLEDSSSSVENYAVAEQAIDRISLALGGSHVLPVAFDIIPRFIRSAKWEERRGALMSIAYLAEGCSEILQDHLDGVMQMVFISFQDPNQRVRYAACHALGQLCTDFQETLQEKYHYKCAESLMSALLSPPNHPRVQTHAASALVNFCDSCDREILAPYLDGFVSNLILLISSPKTYAQEQAVATLSVVADVCQGDFVKYYPSVMPILIQIIENAKDPNYRTLRAKAIDAATLIAVAVGHATFLQHAKPIVDAMVELQKNAPVDDPIHVYLPSCWIRICTLFEKEFHPLMELVWPSVMKRAMLEPDIALLDMDEDLTEDHQSGDWEFASVNGKKIGIRTSTLEEKCSAVENIQAYAEILKSTFAPYCGDVLKLLVSLFSFEYHDGVRNAAVSAVVPVFRCLLSAATEKGMNASLVWNQWYPVIKELLDTISGLDCSESEFICQVFDTLGQCILLFGEHTFDSMEYLQLLFTIMEDLLKEISDAISRFEVESARDASNEPDEDEVESEENVLIELSKLIRNLLKVYIGSIKGMLKPLVSFFTGGLSSTRSIVRHVSICFFSDLVEFAGPAESIGYASLFCEKLHNSLQDEAPEVRQAAAFTIGVCALYGGSPFAQFCQACIPRLFELCRFEGARNHVNILVTENAISTLAKIFTNHSHLENESLIKEWVHLLPVSNDEDEHEYVYTYFATKVAKHAHLWSSLEDAKFICAQFVDAYTNDNCSAQFKPTLASAFSQFLTNFPSAQLQLLLSSCPSDKLKLVPLNIPHYQ